MQSVEISEECGYSIKIQYPDSIFLVTEKLLSSGVRKQCEGGDRKRYPSSERMMNCNRIVVQMYELMDMVCNLDVCVLNRFNWNSFSSS